jgi:hypothetical protein
MLGEALKPGMLEISKHSHTKKHTKNREEQSNGAQTPDNAHTLPFFSIAFIFLTNREHTRIYRHRQH